MGNQNLDSLGLRVNYLDKDASLTLSNYLSQFLKEETLIVCIGTDKCIGDCLGPLVGTTLKKSNFPYPVIGTLDNPAHAINLESILINIKKKYPNHFIIAIDACLGFEECIGDIQVKLGPVHPGKGVGKSLPNVGNLSIVGVVDSIDNSDLFPIRNTRLSFIMNMAEVIASSLLMACKKQNG